jgi:hypothetical protein
MIEVATILPQFGTDKWWSIYQRPLLFLLNNPVPRVREYFRDNIVACDHLDPRIKIAKITGNSVHYQVDKDIRTGNFYSLKSNDNHIRKNFERVIMPLHNWDLRLNKRLVPVFDLGFSSGTWNSTTNDGYIVANNATWSVVRGAAAGTSATTNGTNGAVANCFYSKGQIYIYRSFYYFDTTSMGSGQSVSLATFSLRGVTNGQSNASVQQGTQSATLVKEDFDLFTGSYFGKTTSWVTNGYNDMSLDTSGKTYINNSSDVRMCIREYDHDYMDSSSGSSSYANNAYYANNGSNYPKLYIEYAASASSHIKTGIGINQANIKTGNGIAVANLKTMIGIANS